MLIIPAIDIKDGCVVRFVQGKLNKKVYSRDPLQTARHWQSQGAELIHIVDLDGAVSGALKNLDIVKRIAGDLDVPIQFGGGVRTIEAIEKLRGIGISRIVLGTKAALDKDFLKKAFKKFKDGIIVSVDAHIGHVCVKGWQSKTKLGISTFVEFLKNIGFKQIIYTDISKDGTLKGPNVKDTKRILKESKMQIIVSGGISSLDDIYKLKLLERQGVTGIIIGKALYEGRFTLKQALKLT
ncbi:MAG: 1-(5-phosphoribosyl)-5-[(5-phosphoribosylamino)methylideneamino]imidazole-4-carboxamide isomerase [Candidatus Omnitrophica bacterium]|nr:1-(5-phosphoribosyl)-5-[(5-phosphoribosylamino)methylideneamino]imidazole-4-carboxamide isomerase [Candidatus Omnitrophota bacterium]